ncbi:MAG: MFS transporter [Rectinemataceae bacterium]|jgi:EmrB/QacA subfamily drug resistance transporter
MKIDKEPGRGYKWIALSNTTLGTLMASINNNIVLISLPSIFNGLGINPLAPNEAFYLLWILMGYSVVVATLLVSFGRLSDMFGRVRLYNLGFAVFTAASLLLFLTPGKGNAGALEIVIFRMIQAIGGGFLLANSAAILTDAFPPLERGMALGLNQIAFIGGSLIGLILGGFLAVLNWRLVFLVSVPIGIAGTIWAYLKLKETGAIARNQKLDLLGVVTFGAGLIVLLVALNYGIMPYGRSVMGWESPMVVAGIVVGLLLLAAFVLIERRVRYPMFRLSFFRIRMFAAGNLSGFLYSVAQGGLQFMLIIWLQGIWLPLHGYNYEDTPLWAGIYMAPMLIGFFIMGPLSGWLSDRHGSRGLATLGLVVVMAGFLLLVILPANFAYPPFMLILILVGLGMGLFSSPNMTAIMNSVPPEYRGVASGMRATIQNAGTLVSMSLFFSMVIVGLARHLPGALYSGLVAAGIPADAATQAASLPPTGALFAAFLGYNPMRQLLSPAILAKLSEATKNLVLGKQFFPSLMAPVFMASLRLTFYGAAALSLIASIVSFLRGGRYIHEMEV